MSNTIQQTPTFKLEGDNLVLLEDASFEGNLRIRGDIYCSKGKYSLTVCGNIEARNIEVYNIIAGNIRARNINAYNIDVVDIDAFDINGHDINANDINANMILCDKRRKRTRRAETNTKLLVQNTYSLEFKERMPEETKK